MPLPASGVPYLLARPRDGQAISVNTEGLRALNSGVKRGTGMERIAPLARILAEANGIDWQQLRGSGPGGMVVEQDILNYLSRVMSGEEEPPATPVDELPEGWTGDEQLPAGMFDAAQLSQAGVDSDIADFVTRSRAAQGAVQASVQPPVQPPALAPDPAMDFELDDDEFGDLNAPLAAEPQPTLPPPPAFSAPPAAASASLINTAPPSPWVWSAPQAQSQAQARSVTPPPTPAADHAFSSPPPQEIVVTPEPARVQGISQAQMPAEAAVRASAPEATALQATAPADVQAGGGVALGLSGLLSRLYRRDKPAPSAPAPAQATEVQIPEVRPAAPSLSGYAAPPAPDQDEAPLAQSFGLGTETGLNEAYAVELDAPEFDLQAPATTVPEPPMNAFSNEFSATEAPVAGHPVVEEPVAEALVAEGRDASDLSWPEVTVPEMKVPEVKVPEWEAPAAKIPEISAPDLDDLEAPQVDDYVAPEIDAELAAAPQAAAQPEIQQSASRQPKVQQPGVQQPESQPAVASPGPGQSAGAVWSGIYLRRDAGVAAANDLRAQLSEALGQDVSLAFLVARAAQRHADILGLDLGHVALRGADGQDQPITGGAIREALNARTTTTVQDGDPDLLVTDAAALGADDLHYPQTLTLSLGRVQEGRAALSLNGDVDPQQAAQFLTRVAEALEKPISLVL